PTSPTIYTLSLHDALPISYYVTDIDLVEPTALDIARQIRSQYTIGYSPTNQKLDGSYRKIKVVAGGHDGLGVRTRPGYWATAPRSEEHTSELQSPYDLVCR